MPLFARTLLVPILAATLVSCRGSHPSATGDALLDVQNDELPMTRRVGAVEEAWSKVEAGAADRGLTRRALAEEVVWDRQAHPSLRLAAMRALLSDRTPEGEADSVDLSAALLPTEKDRDLIELISVTAAARGWTALTPSLVRSLATHVPRVEDADRPEAGALRAFHPGQPLDLIVFDVFLDPMGPESNERGRRAARVASQRRGAAWDLLARLDPTGEQRMRLVRERLSRGQSDPALLAVAACVDELACVPVTGDELRWVVSLHDPSDSANAAWWGEARQAVARLDASRRDQLRVRHLEPLRWTFATNPSRAAADRSTLMNELASRLSGRTFHQRTADSGAFGRNASERLGDQASRLSWPDLITILAIDDALAHADVRSALRGQAASDHADTSTEYGGALQTVRSSSQTYHAVPYVPRPTQREHDRKYVPPPELLDDTDRALAHFHFHVNKIRNNGFAGPGEGDQLYAARSGRSCLVFTSVAEGQLNADYYQPNGVVLDLGVLAR